MKGKSISKKGDVFNADDKATCNETAQQKEQTMDKEMDKEGKVNKEKAQEQLQPKEINKKKQSQMMATHLFSLCMPQMTS